MIGDEKVRNPHKAADALAHDNRNGHSLVTAERDPPSLPPVTHEKQEKVAGGEPTCTVGAAHGCPSRCPSTSTCRLSPRGGHL